MNHVRVSGIPAGVLMTFALLAVCLALLPSGGWATRAGAKGNRQRGGDAWSVLPPVSYKNLTLFPVRGPNTAPAGDYVTLDEGIKRGTVEITERGAGQMVRRQVRGRAQQVNMTAGDGATVNQLALVNRSGKKLLLLSGEVIVGGKQDRIVQEDRIVPPVSVPVSIDVFCVEHGRWSQRASAGSAGAPVIAPSAQPRKAENFYSLGAVAHPKLRGAAQDKKEQTEVWKEVSDNNARLGTDNTTGTYQEVYASKKVAGQLEEYIAALQKEVLQPGVVGVIVARNGEPVWADVFASQTLFAAYWPKLLKSYAVEAVGDYKSDEKPTVEQARRYLSERDGTVSTAGLAGVYQLVKTEHPEYAVFVLSDISLPAPLRLHFNKMER
ncbi:MAG TPA: DUF6569 family protein [Pyrinomonadaceae bacterium]|nr:DUF6569 family protein [Pyrinomonadaceae bacterium]